MTQSAILQEVPTSDAVLAVVALPKKSVPCFLPRRRAGEIEGLAHGVGCQNQAVPQTAGPSLDRGHVRWPRLAEAAYGD